MFKRKFNILAWMLATGISLTAVSCDDDDDMDDNPIEDQTELEVNTQLISRNQVIVDAVEVPDNGWIVIHRDNGNNAPVVPDIISVPKQIPAGQSDDVVVEIDTGVTLNDGEKVWVMLHNDSGTEGVYEFNGAGTPDQPLTDDGNIVMESIMLDAPTIDVSTALYDAATHSVIVTNVNAATDGWLVVHNDDGTGNIVLPGIIGKTQVDVGVTQNVTIPLDTSVTINTGQMLFPMLHIDNGTIGTYEFDGSPDSNDPPEIFGFGPNNVVVKAFMVQ